jgi:hypothetical protein
MSQCSAHPIEEQSECNLDSGTTLCMEIDVQSEDETLPPISFTMANNSSSRSNVLDGGRMPHSVRGFPFSYLPFSVDGLFRSIASFGRLPLSVDCLFRSFESHAATMRPRRPAWTNHGCPPRARVESRFPIAAIAAARQTPKLLHSGCRLPLSPSDSASATVRLQLILEANLTAPFPRTKRVVT